MANKKELEKNMLPSRNFRVKACIKGDDGKYHYKSFTASTLKEAKMKKQMFLLKQEKGYGNSPDIRLRDAYMKYVDNLSHILSPSTLREYTRASKADFPSLMSMRISEIKQTDIQREVNIMAKTHAPKTVHNAHGLLSSVLKTYRPDFALATKLPPKQPRKPYVPSDDDINRLIQGVKGTELCKAILLAAFGSFRRSEIAAFTADDIDRDTCIISVNKAMVYSDEKRWVIKNFPKTDAGFRDVTIPLFVVDALPTSGRLVNLLPSSITDGFRKKLKKLGIKHFRFHDLRHYQASILHAMGVPDHYIMERGGWKSDYTLKTVYRHTMDEKRKEVERGINEYFTNRFGHDIGHEQ